MTAVKSVPRPRVRGRVWTDKRRRLADDPGTASAAPGDGGMNGRGLGAKR